ncbi:hypothetical protein PVAP13_4KG064333 [Panicum virgatum]|uniref:Uncharacterized protein n=1 Tax=Panicum virgatum TaxID=38727 RepID=A0A8T0TD95_PANVG|nr:hypothetical protein PVAP13_4KG064333 [Panicum virgatum]
MLELQNSSKSHGNYAPICDIPPVKKKSIKGTQ